MIPNYRQPTNLHQALSFLAEGPMTPLAGGTDIYPAMANGNETKSLLDLSRIGEFRFGIDKRDGGWVISPLATWTTIVQAALPPQFAGLQSAAVEIGGPQIQNRGTVIGNVCNASPAADGTVALLALDAKVRLASISGERVVPLADFVVGNRVTLRRSDELVTGIEVPDWGARSAGAFRKLGARRYLVISIVMVGATLAIDDDGLIERASLAVGSCGACAVRLTSIEQALIGRPLNDEIVERVRSGVTGITPIDDVRASALYRVATAPELVLEALQNCRTALREKRS